MMLGEKNLVFIYKLYGPFPSYLAHFYKSKNMGDGPTDGRTDQLSNTPSCDDLKTIFELRVLFVFSNYEREYPVSTNSQFFSPFSPSIWLKFQADSRFSGKLF